MHLREQNIFVAIHSHNVFKALHLLFVNCLEAGED